MEKLSFKPGTMLNPLPAVMVSCGDETEKNIITIAWTGIVNSNPPMTYISVMKKRYSHSIISRTGEFVINLCSQELTFAADYCGVRSGADTDKFKAQNLTAGPCKKISCPLIREAPVNLECKVKEIHEYPSHDMFVAEIVNVQVNENLLDEKGKICLEKADLVAYVHGAYHPIVRKPIGRFGYSVMKPKTRKRIAAQKRTGSRRGGKTRTGRKR